MASGLVCRTNRPNTWLHRPAANVKKALANSEPSTHGTSRRFAARHSVATEGTADIAMLRRLSDANDPTETLTAKICCDAQRTPSEW